MERFLLVLALVAFFLICASLMWLGYRNRRKRQTVNLPSFPAVPENLNSDEQLEPLEGVYVSTTTTESWQDRVAIGDYGFRSRVSLRSYPEGLYFERVGAEPLWIPKAAVEHARTAKGLAGKVMGTESLLVFRWTVEDSTFDTGVLADDPAEYSAWLETYGEAAKSAAGKSGDELTKGEPR